MKNQEKQWIKIFDAAMILVMPVSDVACLVMWCLKIYLLIFFGLIYDQTFIIWS